MNVVLSCCGEGFGHASRLVALAQKLQERHRIYCFCPHSVSSFIRESIPDIRLVTIPHLHFAKNKGRIQYLRTISGNFLTVVNIPVVINRLGRLMKELDIDAVITDFDPFTSCAAHKYGIPNLEINHPGIILRYFSLSPDALIAQLVALFMESFFTRKINCSFYSGDVGPIIRDEILHATLRREDFYLVYFTGVTKQKVLEILEPFKKVDFKIFPDPETDFVETLASCRGVITTAGHQMMCEALYLKKPLLVIPQKGQFEQRLNAEMLKKSGRGMRGSLRSLHNSVSMFIENIDSFPLHVPDSREQLLTSEDRTGALDAIEEFFREEISRGTAAPVSRKKHPVEAVW